MTDTIYKYRIKLEDEFYIDLPIGYEILTVDTQHNGSCKEQPNIWVRVNSDNVVVPTRFFVLGTGFRIDDEGDMRYVGTFQMRSGDLVFHLFVEV